MQKTRRLQPGVPYDKEKFDTPFRVRGASYSHVFVKKGLRSIVLKDPSIRDERQFSFKSSDYKNGEEGAREHALLLARVYKLLAEKTYFPPSTTFGVYSTIEKRRQKNERVFRVFAVMPRLKEVKSRKEIRRPVNVLFSFLEKHGIPQDAWYVGKDIHPPYTSNFGKDRKGIAYAIDVDVWRSGWHEPSESNAGLSATERLPAANQLKKILEKEGIDFAKLLKRKH